MKKSAPTEPHILKPHQVGTHTYHTIHPKTQNLESIAKLATPVTKIKPSRYVPGDVYAAHLRSVNHKELTPRNRNRSEKRAERLERMINVLFTDNNQAFMTSEQAAEYFGVSKSTIYRDVAYLRDLTEQDIHFSEKAPFQYKGSTPAALPSPRRAEQLLAA